MIERFVKVSWKINTKTGALSDGVCSTVQSRGPAENLLFSITPWLAAGKDRHYYAAAVPA